MKTTIGAALALAIGVLLGTTIKPTYAQPDAAATCSVGEASAAACVGKWVFFAGNNNAIDNGAWVVRIDGDTGAVWMRDGNNMEMIREPD